MSGSPAGIVNGNNFKSNINAWAGGTARLFEGAGLRATTAGVIDFYFMGSESSWDSTFTAGGGAISFTQPSAFNAWTPMTWIGSMAVGGGAITDLHFSSNKGPFCCGTSAKVGVDSEFGIMTNGGQFGLNEVLLAYDDNGAGPDDDYDDQVILARFSAFVSVVPEPATWLMLILGFGVTGMVVRQRSRSVVSMA